jgi:large subunit ribosomal protein L21
MFAVIKTGGKQYKVAAGDIIIVEKLLGEEGSSITFDQVLMLGEDGKAPTVGTPLVADATVTGEVVEQGRAAKITVFKKKRRKDYRRTRGHRQDQTVLRIVDVNGSGPKKAAKKDAAPEPATGDDAAAKPETAADGAAAATKSEAAPKAKATPKAKAAPKPKSGAKAKPKAAAKAKDKDK